MDPKLLQPLGFIVATSAVKTPTRRTGHPALQRNPASARRTRLSKSPLRLADYRRREDALALLLGGADAGASIFETGARALALGLGYRWAGPAPQRDPASARRARPSKSPLRLADYRRREDALALLLGGADAGASIFETGARALALGLGYRWAGIGKIVDDGCSGRLLAFWDAEYFADVITYTLAGTPCGVVAGNGQCFYPDRVSELFPDDHLLVELGAVSYLGQMIFDHDNVPLGYVFAMHDRPERHKVGPLRDFVGVVARWIGDQLRRHASEDTLRANASLRLA